MAKKYKLPLATAGGRPRRSVHSRFFTIKLLAPIAAESRFGVVISKKNAAAATVRNRLKRLVFNFLRRHHSHLPHADYLIIIRSAAPTVVSAALNQDLEIGFKNLISTTRTG